MENNTIFKTLSAFGYSQYIITAEGKLFNPSQSAKELKHDNKYRFYIINDNGQRKKVSLKTLYRMAYNKEFCIDNIQDMPKEEWKKIPGTRERYSVSNYGRIKSFCGYKAIILKPYKKYNGYLIVKINGKNIMIHQIVAFAFCDNQYKGEKVQIHHKDKNRQNNKAENLQILSIAEHHKQHQKENINNENVIS